MKRGVAFIWFLASAVLAVLAAWTNAWLPLPP